MLINYGMKYSRFVQFLVIHVHTSDEINHLYKDHTPIEMHVKQVTRFMAEHSVNYF